MVIILSFFRHRPYPQIQIKAKNNNFDFLNVNSLLLVLCIYAILFDLV